MLCFLLISLSGADWWGPGWEVTDEDGGTRKRARQVPECVCGTEPSGVAGFGVHLLRAEALCG